MTSKTKAKAQAAGLALLLASATASAAADKCHVRALEIPVTMKGSRAVATVGLNGKQVPLTVDSGAFFSFLTPAAAQQLGLKQMAMPSGLRVEGLNGQVDTTVAVVKEMELVGGSLPDMEFLVGGNEPGAGTMGLLGRNILAVADVEYDLAHGAIRIALPQGDCSNTVMAYWAGDQPVSELTLLRDERRSRTPAIKAIVELNGKPQRVLFDTGASSLVSLTAAKRLGLSEADMEPAGRSYGAGLGYASSWVARFDSFKIGDERISNIRARVVDFEKMADDMLLGIDFFLSHRIYIAKAQRRMFFTYNGGPVFALSETAAPPADAAASAPELANADAYARRGAAAASRKDFAAALADLDRAVALAPASADLLVQRGHLHESLHRGKEALADYEAALRIEPQHPDALLRRAWFRQQHRDREGALDDLQALDGLLAPQANQRQQMARLFVRLDLHERAIPQWDRWIASHDQDIGLPGALNERCWTRMLLNQDLDQALKDCERAVDAESSNARFIDSRGWVQLRRGNAQRALADFERSLKLDGEQPWALYGRGLARRKLGQAEAGQADLDAARTLSPKIDEQTARWGLVAGG